MLKSHIVAHSTVLAKANNLLGIIDPVGFLFVEIFTSKIEVQHREQLNGFDEKISGQENCLIRVYV